MTDDAKVELVERLRANIECAKAEAIECGVPFMHIDVDDADSLLAALEQSDAVMEQDTGVPFGPGSRPADRAASTGVSPVPASIPNAVLTYVEGDIRAPTGPLQIGEDWPGLFIRGDDALGLAISLRMMDASPIYAGALPRIIWLLESSNARHHASAIEARRAETQGGSVADESAVVASGDETPESSSIAPVQDDER